MASSPESSASRVLLCVSGSIAAYKAADVVSQLTKKGIEVQCLLTEGAQHFVTPLVLETLSGKPALSQLWGPEVSGTEHIRLARWPDLVVFAPATAHLLAKLSLGLADDLVTTVALATDRPWLVAPAMNTVMWDQAITQQHVQTLKGRGAQFIEPADGKLACGEEGAGKLATPETIVAAIEAGLKAAPARSSAADLNADDQDLRGIRVLITAGPTTSAIDAVRYLTNHSTGKMGAELAQEALSRGAEVDYILGVDKGVVRPVAPMGSGTRLHITEVKTAEEMLAAALKALPRCHGVIATAAVLDYKVEKSNAHKEKRGTESIQLSLVPSADVLQGLRDQARADQWFLGFAAETDDVEAYGESKLKKKKLDYLFANQVAKLGEKRDTGFGTETNSGVLLSRVGKRRPISLGSKRAIAHAIWDVLAIETKR